MSRRHAPLLLAALAVAGAGPAAAQQDRDTDPRWLPWLGCWEPVAAEGPAAGNAARGKDLRCVAPDPASRGVEIATLVGGDVVARRSLDVEPHRSESFDRGCRVMASARWSRDGRRLYTRTLYVCLGGRQWTSTAVAALLPSGEWLDAELVRSGDGRLLEVRRYRPAPEEAARAAGRTPMPAGLERAVEMARRTAAMPLSLDDVVEASRKVDPEAVRALLADAGIRFAVDRAALLRLARERVHPDIVDLLVALSFPDRFALDRTGPAPVVRARRTEPGPFTGERGRRRMAWRPRTPVTIIRIEPRERESGEERSGGKAVDGVGYRRGDAPVRGRAVKREP